MPLLKLRDAVGGLLTIDLSERSFLARYARPLEDLGLEGMTLAELQAIGLDQSLPRKVVASLTLSRSVTLGSDGPELHLDAGASGRMQLSTPQDRRLFSPDNVGDPVPIAAGEAYLGVLFNASVDLAAAPRHGGLGFSFKAGSGITLGHFRRFRALDSEPLPSLRDALRATLAGFGLPADVAGLRMLPPGSIATVEGDGELRLGARLKLAVEGNALASLALGEPFAPLKLAHGRALDLDARIALSGRHQLRVHRVDEATVRIGLHRHRESALTVEASAEAALDGGRTGNAWIDALLGALAPDPEVASQRFLDAGVPAARIAEIERALRGGAERRLQLAVEAALADEHDDNGAFLWEVDLDRIDSRGEALVAELLRGELGALAAAGAELPPGLALRRSVLASIERRTTSLRVQLLGLLHVAHTSALVVRGRTAFDPRTGDWILGDEVAASQIDAALGPHGDPQQRLRRLHADSFLVSAAYRVGSPGRFRASLGLSQLFVAETATTPRALVRQYLAIAEALHLATAAECGALLGARSEFGRMLFVAEARYSDDELGALFFDDDGRPRTQGCFEAVGRRALLVLVQDDDPDRARRLPLLDDPLWQEIRRVGPFNLHTLEPLRLLTAPLLAQLASDATVVAWWASAMAALAVRLAEVRALELDADVLRDDPRLLEARSALAYALRGIARTTRPQFGEPWGLLAMDLASGGRAAARVELVGPHLALELASRRRRFLA